MFLFVLFRVRFKTMSGARNVLIEVKSGRNPQAEDLICPFPMCFYLWVKVLCRREHRREGSTQCFERPKLCWHTTPVQHVSVPPCRFCCAILYHFPVLWPGLLRYDAGSTHAWARLVQVYPENRRLSQEGHFQGRKNRFATGLPSTFSCQVYHTLARSSFRYDRFSLCAAGCATPSRLSCFCDAVLDLTKRAD